MNAETLKRAKEVEQEIVELRKIVNVCSFFVDGCISAFVSAGEEEIACLPIKLSQEVFSQSEIKERALSRISELQNELANL